VSKQVISREPDRIDPSTPERTGELVEIAAEMFRERGYEGTSMQDIADRMGILKGSLYHYIDSKEDLLWMICKEPFVRLDAGVREIAHEKESGRSDRLTRMGAMHGQNFEDYFPFMTVLTQDNGSSLSADRRRELSDLQSEYVKLWGFVIESGKQNGEFRSDLDVELATFALLGALSWMFRWFRPDGRLHGADVGRILVEDFVLGALSRTELQGSE
jgi:TetR/AcrR family transcriptional regulator, cholesterol catabolism regulator